MKPVEVAAASTQRIADDPALFRLLVEGASEGVALASEDGIIVYANPAKERMFGYAPGEMVGMHVSEQNAYPPADNVRIVAEVIDKLKENGEWCGNWLNRRRDGSVFVTTAKMKTVFWGGERYWLSIQTEPSRPAEETSAIVESELRLRLAADAASLGVWDWDLASNTFRYSPRAKEIYGFPPHHEPTFEDIDAATDPRDRARSLAQMDAALNPQQRDRSPFEYRIIRDAQTRWVEAHGFAVFETHQGQDRAVRYVGTLRDITDQKLKDDADRLTIQRLQLALDAARMAVWEVDFHEQKVHGSVELNRLYGFADDATPSFEDFRSRYLEEDRVRVAERWRDAAVGRARFVDTQSRIALPDGTIRWIQTRSELFYDSDMPIRAVGIVIDVTDRKRDEATLQAIVASDLIGLAVYDFETDAVTLINDRFLHMTGKSRADFDRGQWDWRAITPPEYLPVDADAIAQARARGWYDPYEKEYLLPSGDRIRVRLSSAPLPGYATRIVVYAEDVTDEWSAKRAQKRAMDRLQLATKTGRLGSFDYDVTRGVLEWDAAQLAIFGRQSPPEAIDDIFDQVHPDDRGRLSQLYETALLDGKSYTGEFRVIRPDGAIRWCIGSTAIETDETGSAARVYGYTIDVTDQRNVEHELAEREALLSGLFDAAELFVGMVELTPDGIQFVLANKRTRTYHQIPDDAKFPVDAKATRLSEQDIALWRKRLLDTWQSGAPSTTEFPYTRSDHGAHWYLATYSPLASGPSGLPRLAFVIVDVSGRKQAEDRQTLLMQEVDHRAKNALAVVQAVVRLTREEDPAAFRSAVIGRIGAIARVHGFLAADRWTGVSLRRLLEDELAPFGGGSETRIILEGPAFALPASQAQSIALVLHELATNAAKYGALSVQDGVLQVVWRVDRDGALVLLWREFRPDLADSPIPSREGFGFQLLEQTIGRQLNGDWSVEWIVGGVAFTLRIPTNGAWSASQTDRSSPIADCVTAMIVEDEPLIALELEQTLLDAGFAVIAVCPTITEARHVLERKGPPKIAFLDVNVGGEMSFDFALEASNAGCSIVFCTGYESIQGPTALSGAPRLTKPVSPQSLRTLLADQKLSLAD